MADINSKEQSELDQDLDDVEEVEGEEMGEETKIKARQLTVQMMQKTQILAALQERLDGLVDTGTGYIESLPRVVKRRVNALKNLQVKCAQIEAKFYEEVHDLERKYAVLYQPLFDKRFEIINAIYEPTEEEWCQIDWKKGKNVTLKTIKKKPKHKGRGRVRTVTKTISNDSFFNVFAPPDVPESGDLDAAAEAILAADFEIGHFLHELIIPRLVLYFTGEAIEDGGDDYDEEGEEADEEGEEDEENDPVYDPKMEQNPAECKQQ
ncbi:Nucleosome assembly protein 1-like 1 [Heterocephalus glaber]|uniref:Nucleosome assembly protein 1-like 1 n=1 Tax=Heterocephalus glaber TaxID=10181 RepID=G5B123_HETGA|nr:Nucleosome assembly protein 1-like 1 [Heterocephalus glaber]